MPNHLIIAQRHNIEVNNLIGQAKMHEVTTHLSSSVIKSNQTPRLKFEEKKKKQISTFRKEPRSEISLTRRINQKIQNPTPSHSYTYIYIYMYTNPKRFLLRQTFPNLVPTLSPLIGIRAMKLT